MVIGSDETGAAEMSTSPSSLKKLQDITCETLMKLILRKRTVTEPILYKRPYKWNQYKSDELLNPNVDMNNNLQEKSTKNEYIYYTYHQVPYLENAAI